MDILLRNDRGTVQTVRRAPGDWTSKNGGGNGLGLAHSYSAPLISSVNGFKVFSEKTKKLNLDNPTKYS